MAHGPFFRQVWPHRAISPVDSWFEWVDAFEWFKVSAAVGNARNHGADLIEPMTKPAGGDVVNNGCSLTG